MPAPDVATLRAFRTDLHGCFPRRADALIELIDALLTAGPVASLPQLSLQAAHRRGWGSLYDALAEGRIDADALCARLVQHPASNDQPVYAVDLSIWPRCDAEASPDRGFYYHPSRHSAGQPIVAGWSYLWLARLSPTADSWTAPADVHRLAVADNLTTVAVARIQALLPRLGPLPVTPLCAFDAGFDPVQLTVGLRDADAQAVVRIRDDRKFFGPPPPHQPGQGGRPR